MANILHTNKQQQQQDDEPIFRLIEKQSIQNSQSQISVQTSMPRARNHLEAMNSVAFS